MKATRFVKANFFVGGLILTTLFFSFTYAFAASDSVTASSDADQLLGINKKLDALQKQKEQILANQERMINEVVKSRKWAFNNRGRHALA